MPITALVAVKNEMQNLSRCLEGLRSAERVIVIDSHSTDGTPEIAERYGAEVVQFDYSGGYPKKRQWALDTLGIISPWVFLIDADEYVTSGLWSQIEAELAKADCPDGFTITKDFHFLGRRMRHGGFSHAAVLLFRMGKGRFERIFDDEPGGLDMEVHERVIVDGRIEHLDEPLVHEDFKGLEAYVARHNKYSTWEARVRHSYLKTGCYGQETVQPTIFGNTQERRRWVKMIVIRLPFEPWLWFFYHYLLRFGFLEGQAGLIAAQIRKSYIEQVRAKVYEIRLQNGSDS